MGVGSEVAVGVGGTVGITVAVGMGEGVGVGVDWTVGTGVGSSTGASGTALLNVGLGTGIGVGVGVEREASALSTLACTVDSMSGVVVGSRAAPATVTVAGESDVGGVAVQATATATRIADSTRAEMLPILTNTAMKCLHFNTSRTCRGERRSSSFHECDPG